jgi:hypothetical protein
VGKEATNRIPPLCILPAIHSQDSIPFSHLLAIQWEVVTMEEGDEGEEAEVSEDSLVSQAQTTSVPLASMTTTCSLEDRTEGGGKEGGRGG